MALRAELARQVELISESRSRLTTAHLEERQRIERDLHDGAQQRLLAIALQLQSAQVNGEPEVLRAEVDRAVNELGVTVQELRDLAGGLQPAALAGGGLLAAVVDLVGRIPLTIDYDVVDRRFPSSIESGAWFVIAEAVANAVKHANVSEVSISVTSDGSVLQVVVRGLWDRSSRPAGAWVAGARRPGRGFARPAPGGGEPAARHRCRGGAAMRVVIADDSSLLREGLARLLTESGVVVCETVADAETLAESVAVHRPDVAIVDIRMPPTFTHEGAVAAIELRSAYPDLGILLLSQAVETHFAAQLLEKHAARFGYLLKDRVVDVAMLTQALETIAAGGTVLDPQIVRSLLHSQARESPVQGLSERERDVLALIAEGRSNAAIAERLVVSGKTVESHIANIFTKLGLHDEPGAHRRRARRTRGSPPRRQQGRPALDPFGGLAQERSRSSQAAVSAKYGVRRAGRDRATAPSARG